jgi:hypothetical protein
MNFEMCCEMETEEHRTTGVEKELWNVCWNLRYKQSFHNTTNTKILYNSITVLFSLTVNCDKAQNLSQNNGIFV